MVEDSRAMDRAATVVLAVGIFIALAPLYLMLTTASSSIEQVAAGTRWWPGRHLFENLAWVWTRTDIPAQLFNSLVIALTVTFGSSLLAFITAFALVYFDSRLKSVIFALVIATLMLPLEVRIVPTYAVAANVLSPLQTVLDALRITPLLASIAGHPVRLELNLLDTYAGLTLPLLSTATGTFMFRQFLKSLPKSLGEAARMDGAGPLRFMLDILLPLSAPTFVALGILMFLGAWNQYLWPLLATTDGRHLPAVVGLARLDAGIDAGEIPRYHYQMAAALIVVLPPLLVVGVLQRWMVRGLVLSEK